jgi:hypothetical protein
MQDEKKAYISPRVETLEVRALVEAVGPAQALASGADTTAALLTKDSFRSGTSRRGRGPR